MPFNSVVDPQGSPSFNLDPNPHQIKIRIRIRIKIYKLDPEPDPDPHQFADFKQKCMEYEPIRALFQRLEPFSETRIWIWIRIRIRVKSWIRIRINVMGIDTAFYLNNNHCKLLRWVSSFFSDHRSSFFCHVCRPQKQFSAIML